MLTEVPVQLLMETVDQKTCHLAGGHSHVTCFQSYVIKNPVSTLGECQEALLTASVTLQPQNRPLERLTDPASQALLNLLTLNSSLISFPRSFLHTSNFMKSWPQKYSIICLIFF